MKLINKFTLWYLGISSVVLLLGGIMIFQKLESEIDFEQGMELERQLDSYAEKLKNGKAPDRLERDRLEITELPLETALQPLYVRDTLAWHDQLEQMERQLKASRSYLINGKHYYLATYNIVIETGDITETVVQTMVAIFILLLIFIAVTGRIVSKKILSPFHESLEKIKSFTFKENEPLVFAPSKTEEFVKLNDFLHKMSVQLLKDYRVMKEFSENISHEIQTPVSVVRGKLELLLDSPIDEKQASLIESAHHANEKVARIVGSLAVLARLENHEFTFSEEIDFSSKVNQSIKDFEELIAIKSISMEKNIQPGVLINIHPNMAEMLLQNLLSNAIKHNVKDGMIFIRLGPNMLEVVNSGQEPQEDVDNFFQRFKKGNGNHDSIGLGLSIVKQICIVNGFEIDYSYRQPHHWVQISFG
ncbi:MAG TPA: HAMP domain-containing sensor histidine kinase [Cyclobacteriaceae bacterium]|nr:HAMP domain-containing sensor histidine kinase [Cyclobacteriaceae bacterium]